MSEKITLDNTVDADMGRAITWQFDNAEKLKGVIFMLRDFFNASTRDLWEKYGDFVDLSRTEDIDDFALSIWGKLLGLERPYVTVNGVLTPLLSEAYRRILLARLRLLNSNASTQAYIEFLSYVFGSGTISMEQGDMAIRFSYTGTAPEEGNTVDYHLYALFNDNPDAIFVYPTGVKSDEGGIGPIFGFEGQQTMGIDGEPVEKVDMNVMHVYIRNTSFSGPHTRITVDVTNIWTTYGNQTVCTGERPLIYIDEVPYYATRTVNVQYNETVSIDFIGAGTSTPSTGSAVQLYGKEDSPFSDGVFQCTVTAVSNFTEDAKPITVRTYSKVQRYTSNSYGAFTTYDYNVPYDIVLNPNERIGVDVYRSNSTATWERYFCVQPMLDEDGDPIEYVIMEKDAENQSYGVQSVYPIGSVPIPAVEGDFIVETMDNGSFAWKRNLT